MITGGIKFFEKSKNLFQDGATINASSGGSSAIYLLSRNNFTYWRSVGSNDITQETIELTFPQATTIDRIILTDHNFKLYDIMYDVAGVWTNFANVLKVNGVSLGSISETVYDLDSSYYEFTQVTTTAIRIRVTTTQVADEQKYLSQIICTKELGTLVGYPDVSSLKLDNNKRVKKSIWGRNSIQESLETFEMSLNFKNYPSREIYHVDLDLMMDLIQREEPFLVMLCGGRAGTQYFTYTLPGFRLKDLIQMKVTNPYALGYNKNVYTLGVEVKVDLRESI